MRTLLLLLILICTDCLAGQREELAAPSGRFSVRADVPVEEVSPSFRLRVRLVFVDTKSRREWQVFTGVEGKQWIIAWTQDDVLILYTADRKDESHPIVFEWKDGHFNKRAPTVDEIRIGQDALDRKYSERKVPNKS